MTEENYHIARKILRTLFDDEVTLKHILYTKLAQLPPCDEEGRHLATLYNQMFLSRQTIFERQDDSTETGLGALLLNKLPFRVRSQIYDRTAHSHNVSPSELLNLLTDIVRKDSTLFEMEYYSRQHRSHDTLYQGFHATARPVRRPQKLPQRKNNVKKCPYCRSALHISIQCTLTKPTRHCFLADRKQSADQSHPAPLTHNRPRTTSTSSSRPRRIYPQRTQAHFVGVSADPTVKNGLESQAQAELRETTTFTCSMNQLSKAEHTSQRATLMCTNVSLFNPSNPSKQVTVTAFLDSSSSKSYITNEAAAAL
ncbi:hypothetical protein OSTOST_13507, partial [Ostertagia ostertagi]